MTLRRKPKILELGPMVAGLVLVLLLGACASDANVENMVQKVEPQAGPSGPLVLKHAIGLAVVDGGRPTVPLFTPEISNEALVGALKQTLEENELWAGTADQGRYVLHASLTRDDRPVRGFDKIVRSNIRYRLQDVRAQRVVLDETIVTTHTVSFNTSAVAVTRQRKANEGAVRKSLSVIVARLRAFQPQPATPQVGS